ncbi:MAG TPA: HD domain-containing phosphohydrolase [Terriglobales bacterium]|nr:HD domain-containing phosphohydrolase [Terriglobales bacterium]
MPLKLPKPSRIPILYVILGVLILVSVVPMYFYSAQVESINRDRLITNERLLQNTVTRSVADDISQHQESLRLMQANLSSALQVASGGDLTSEHVQAPELRALLENFVSSSEDLAYATLLNSEAKGISAGRIAADAFLQRELERAYAAAREGRGYNGQALVVGTGKSARTVMLVSTPVMADGRFVGMIGSVVDLQFLIRRLQDVSRGGLTPYVVDDQGRLVAGASTQYATGQDMNNLEIVRNFVELGSRAQNVAATREFDVRDDKQVIRMLGTYSPVTNLDWAVVVQKPRGEAYRGVYELQRYGRTLAIMAIALSVGISIFAARRITNPLEVLTRSSRAIARGDFTQRVHLSSRTEIGELAATFNVMSAELEQFVLDLKRAANENRELFMGSIQMLAGAVDEKDPYTRGHSDRVTRYSVMIAQEMNIYKDFIEVVRISAQLHDVGKIGIEDRILKKPGALTPEEFEIMKTHTTKGANILRPVAQLKDMIPGIELHHESLDGRGYPHGLKDEDIPLLPRIIAVADTFDALTTTRPYQRAHDPKEALRIIHSLSGKRLDPTAVAALAAIYERGEIQVPRPMEISVPLANAAAAAVVTVAAPSQTSVPGALGTDPETHPHTVAEMHATRF